MSPRSASVPTPTTSGTELSARQIGAWRRRLDERLEVRRDLPWRRTRDPWCVLVAEVMLQQTQVRRVLPAYASFLTEFPDPPTCATAGSGAVIRAWEGLGYHRRALSLHGAAVAITTEHRGVVPSTFDELIALPGVGAYTARAVLAFAFERDVAVVDTNVARILARAIAGTPLRARAAQELADQLVSRGEGWKHNQAMLDLGAMTCKASPECGSCPLRRSCRWARSGFAAPDPATLTAGTSRPQARFEGSDRQARGKVLAKARAGVVSSLMLKQLGESLGAERVARATSGLIADGLLVPSGDGVRLVESSSAL